MGFGSSQSQYWPCWDRKLRGTVRRELQQIQSRTVYPQIFATVFSNLLLSLFLVNKIEKKRGGREIGEKRGEKNRPKHDRTRQSISRWSNKSKDRLLTTVFKPTKKKKNATRISLGFITLPYHYGFSIFPTRQEKTKTPPLSTSHTIEWTNLELLTVWQRVTYTASSWVRVWKESTRYPIHDLN